MRKSRFLVILIALLLPVLTAVAQERELFEEYKSRVAAAQNVSPLGDNAHGEIINEYSGALQFSVVDVSIPGAGPSVEFRRLFDPDEVIRRPMVSREPVRNVTSQGQLGDWWLDIPHLHGTFLRAAGWVSGGANPEIRCDQPTVSTAAPPATSFGPAANYWNGNFLHLPEEGDTELLHFTAGSHLNYPADGKSYRWTTKSGWFFSCLSAANNAAGDAFLAVSPDGTRYWFDRFAKRNAGTAKKAGARDKIYIYPTRIEDLSGNYVIYTYDAISSGQLVEIKSNDGRLITISYASGVVSSVSDGARVWNYSYSQDATVGVKRLSSVTLPDTSVWTYSSVGGPQGAAQSGTGCYGGGYLFADDIVFSSKHPSGAVAKYTLRYQINGRTYAPYTCYQLDVTTWVSRTPSFFASLAVSRKELSGPGIDGVYSWSWTYPTPVSKYAHECTASACVTEKEIGRVNPDGSYISSVYGTRYGVNEGKLIRQWLRSAPNASPEQEAYKEYQLDPSGQPYPAVVGQTPQAFGDPLAGVLQPARRNTLVRDGVTHESIVSVFDEFARPTKVINSSSFGYSKIDIVEYFDDKNIWSIGDVKRRSTDGVEHYRALFGSLGRVKDEYLNGKFSRSFEYHPDGEISSIVDGNGRSTRLDSWKRGVPQLITYADGSSQAAEVNYSGWITSVTDENGYKTCYAYDAMGRLSRITYPSETVTGVCDASAWNEEVFAFMPTTTQFGIPAGHWAQVHTRGGYRKITHFDALWRPIFVQEEGGAATVRYTSQAYDHEGRTTFSSYPVASASHITQLTKGVWTEYDVLGRATSVSQDSELSPSLLTTLTTYAGDSAGPYTRVTDPRGTQTVTRYQMFDQPTYDFPVLVDMAQNRSERAAVDITRDVFGKPLSIRKRNSANTVSLTRSYTYNAYQELCRVLEPETNVTLMGYDGAGNPTWSASGLSAAAAPGCHSTGDQTSINPRKVVRTYDARNRLKTLTFPDGRGNQSWTYTPDGLPAGITTYNETGNAYPVVNAYSYNRRRLLTFETSGQTGWYTWGLGYTYNAHGHLSAQSYPDGQSVSYAPNALGQPTQAGTYATGVSYYPNGAIKQFTYGNGIVHTMTQNARQLPARSTDAIGSSKPLDLGYAYDANGNVGSITDYLAGARQTRGMSYDGLDRLVQTTSSMFGTASYGYNVLDNLTSVKVSGGSLARDHAYVYDASNRLVNIKNTVGGATVVGLGYDPQGNLANKNGQTYSFTYGNRLRAAPGKETYLYDGHGRRVESRTTNYSVWQYSQSGQVMYSHDARNNRKTNYIYLGGSLVALREQPMSGGTTVTVKYQHTDALGTPVAVTDAAKAIVETFEYEPYGQLVNSTLKDGPGFTGHVQDAATGLTYMQQRYYDPQSGLFLSVDPVTAYSNPVGMFNRYRYANNNPYKFTDPDGRAAAAIIPALIVRTLVGAGIGATVNTGVQMAMADGNLKQRFDKVDGRQVAIAAGAGALSGGVSAIADTAKTVGGNILANAVGNAAVGAVSTQASAMADGRTASPSEVMHGAATSGGFAGLGSTVSSVIPSSIAKLPSSGMTQTERTATENLMSHIKLTTPNFSHSNPIQTTANAAGSAIGTAPDLKPLIDKKN